MDSLFQRLEQLNAIGAALSKEKDINRLLEAILLAAKQITHADGGTLYRVLEDGRVKFEIIRTDSLGIAMGGTTGVEIPFYPVHLHDADGRPNNSMVVAYAVLNDTTVNIADAYQAEGFDFSGTKAFDAKTGYRSKSFLTVPMKNHEGEVIGVLQLINARPPHSTEIIPFSAADQQLAESLASQAAIALTNRLLINQLEELFESFINLINTAIDEKSPYTGGHCQRVPALTMMIAESMNREGRGALDEKELYELKLAGMLHDCGKVTTPVHVVDKATKLEKIFDRIELIDTRFEVIKRDAEIERLNAQLQAAREGSPEMAARADRHYEATVAQLQADRAFLRECNLGGEFITAESQRRIAEIAARRWVDSEGRESAFLTDDESYNLNIARGTLNAEDRQAINNHVVMTLRMLCALPWPRHLKNVPEYAGSHHERLDGRGYPRGLTGRQMALQARIIAIADIFEALTAKDRPYKRGKTLTESLEILGRMKLDGHIDPDLFDLFIRDRIYLRYAETFLEKSQIDEVDVTRVPGYAP